MPFTIEKPFAPKKTFILNRTLNLDKDGHVVEDTDVRSVKRLGGPGSAFYEEEAAKYGLDDSHRLVEEQPQPESQPAPVPVPEPEPEPEPQAEPVTEPLPEPDELPEDFPGRKALIEAGITTLSQVRQLENVTDIPGIGEVKAAQIAEALAQ
jgi:hypothetical protein